LNATIPKTVFPSRLAGALSAIFLLLMLALMLGSQAHKKLSYDEYPNLYYGYRFLTEGPLARPDGQRMPALALNALFCLPYQCDSEVLDRSEILRIGVRLPGMIFALLLGVLIFRWSSDLYGREGGLLSLFFYCLNPNFIAHGKQLTTDIPTAFWVTAAMYAFWKLLEKGGLNRLFLFLTMMSAGILSKYSMLLLIPAQAAAGAWAFFKGKTVLKKKAVIPFLALSVFAVLFFINAGYLFQGSFLKAKDYQWESKAYQKYQNLDMPVPLPKVFVQGLDYTKYIDENPHIGRGNNYILGKRHRKGRWYSFPVMILLKTPLAFFAALALSAFARKKIKDAGYKEGLLLWLPFAFWLLMFSVVCDLQLGIRYVLPGMTFLFIFAGRLDWTRSVKSKAAVGVLCAWYAFSSLSYYPHTISYFNEAIGARVNAFKFLSDSNLDWEDKSHAIEKFRSAHPEISFQLDPQPPVPGFILLGANHLTGVLDEGMYQWVRDNFKPIQHVAYSHYLFDIPEEKFREIFPNS
jgi:hypothetical protein